MICKMLKSSLYNSKEVNRARLVEFKMQGDVKMYSQWPGYDDFRGFDVSIDRGFGGDFEANL